MKILYVCHFDLIETSGKSIATFNKVKSLAKMVESLYVIHGKKRYSFLLIPWIEIKALVMILIMQPDVVISRGFVGILFQRLANYMGIVTVREMHADVFNETKHLSCGKIKKNLLKGLNNIYFSIDKSSKIRIFNHPDLLSWYQNNYDIKTNDGFVYNGFSADEKSNLSTIEAKRKFNLSADIKYLVFIGKANKWHGIKYLVDLQKEFDKYGDNIKIICGGGEITKGLDKEGSIINFTPLNHHECFDLIKAADACLLTVNPVRTSPGSPIKLYDYICNDAWVISQANINGYCDEVEKYSVGDCVDFRDTVKTREDVLKLLREYDLRPSYTVPDLSWEFRMRQWLGLINTYIEQKKP